jgi:hypothetical protein
VREYDPEAPLIFIHVPKTGATSLLPVFERWFGDGLRRHYPDPLTGDLPLIASPPPGSCVFGHFHEGHGHGASTRYPGVEQFMTILRDPFDAMVSRYYYVRQIGRDWPETPPPLRMSLEEFLRNQAPNMMNHLPMDLTLASYEEALERSFVHIGITEALEASVRQMARRLGREPPDGVPTLNVTDRPRSFPPHLREEFRERNPVAYAVYKFARERVLVEAGSAPKVSRQGC